MDITGRSDLLKCCNVTMGSLSNVKFKDIWSLLVLGFIILCRLWHRFFFAFCNYYLQMFGMSFTLKYFGQTVKCVLKSLLQGSHAQRCETTKGLQLLSHRPVILPSINAERCF